MTLTSSDTSELTVPATVEIPANMASKNFNVTVVDDSSLDGNVVVTVTAMAPGHMDGSDTLTVVNNDFATLRPAPADDNLVLAPTATAGEYGVTPGPRTRHAGPLAKCAFCRRLGGSNCGRRLAGRINRVSARRRRQTYALTGWAKSGDELGQRIDAGSLQSLGFQSYDADHLLIRPEHVLRHLGSFDTRLAAPLNPGDTVIRLQNASGWSNSGDLAATRGIAWYGYQDSHGTTYADYTYTRNVALGGASGLWSAGDVNGNVITLNAPWAGPTLAAGTAVRNTARAAQRIGRPSIRRLSPATGLGTIRAPSSAARRSPAASTRAAISAPAPPTSSRSSWPTKRVAVVTSSNGATCSSPRSPPTRNCPPWPRPLSTSRRSLAISGICSMCPSGRNTRGSAN